MSLSIKQRALRAVALVSAVASLGSLAACGSNSSSSTSSSASGKASSASSAPAIAKNTVNPGTLTISVGNPCYTPWYTNNDPTNGKGFEDAIDWEVAKRLGFKKSQVKFVRNTYASAIAPGPKNFDFAADEFTSNKEKSKVVRFSPGYYPVSQSVIVSKSGKYANAKKVSDFKDATMATMVGGDSYASAVKNFKNVKTFDTNAEVAQSLASGQADALVVTTPIAINMTKTGEIPNSKVAGQIPGSEIKPGYALLMPKDSKIYRQVNKAVQSMIDDGTIKKFTQQYLKDYTSAAWLSK